MDAPQRLRFPALLHPLVRGWFMKASPAIAVALGLFVCAVPVSAKEVLVDQVNSAISKGIRFLRDIEKNKGNFEHTSAIAPGRPGGVTALAVVALINAGVPADDELIKRCLEYLRSMPPRQTYTVGLQTMAFCLAGQNEDRQLVQR